MKNTTQAPKGQGCVVLTHPRFDRPKVENPTIRGPKKGCVNFLKKRREREYLRLSGDAMPVAAQPTSLNDRIVRLADYVQIVFKVDVSTAYRMAGIAGGEFMRQQAGGAA